MKNGWLTNMEERYYEVKIVTETVTTYGGYFRNIAQAFVDFQDDDFDGEVISIAFGDTRIVSIEESFKDESY
jgi:hypothetical protein